MSRDGDTTANERVSRSFELLSNIDKATGADDGLPASGSEPASFRGSYRS